LLYKLAGSEIASSLANGAQKEFRMRLLEVRRNLRKYFRQQPRREAYSKPEGAYKFAAILADKTRQLLALDRYERRAVSRRNRAIQSLDAVRVLAALSVESADANLATGRS
jgi:hypothetical protein